MGLLIFIAFVFLLFISPVFRCAVFHPFKAVKNAVVDVYVYIKEKRYNVCPIGELVCFIGLFGKGKTLSLVYTVIGKYKRYNDKMIYDKARKKFVKQRVVVISNVALSIPYQEFVSMQQIVESTTMWKKYDEEHDTKTVVLILGDEFSVQMNSRSFKSNLNPLLLNTILTCRHHNIWFGYSAQRFAHVDALLRQVTSYVVDCDKLWRFQRNYRYDAWQMENATDPLLLKPYRRDCWFVTNKNYNDYDTLACVGNLTKSWSEDDMLSEEEILALQNAGTVNADGIVNPSRKMKKQWKRRK